MAEFLTPCGPEFRYRKVGLELGWTGRDCIARRSSICVCLKDDVVLGLGLHGYGV